MIKSREGLMMRTKLMTFFFFFALALSVTQASAKTRAGKTAREHNAGAGQKAAAPFASEHPLSDEQKRAIHSILTKSKMEGVALALLGAQGAKEFDENVLSEQPNAEADQKATKKLTDAVAGVTALRLQTIRDVVALLTPEQKQLLRAEMAKPGTPTALLEVLARVFKLPDE
jgi:Spy/CpxP family protein refolding chaperone